MYWFIIGLNILCLISKYSFSLIILYIFNVGCVFCYLRKYLICVFLVYLVNYGFLFKFKVYLYDNCLKFWFWNFNDFYKEIVLFNRYF